MDRQMVYSGQIPLETDLLNTNKNAMVALGKLAGAIFGSNTYVNGLSVGANSPAALNVVVQPGEIYSLQNIDGTPYSSLAADTAHQIVKQGILLDAVTLPTPAPGSAGQSINYLIQASFSEVDGGATVLPYYNSSNPAQAYSGPANSGSTSYTKRQGTVLLSAKAGVAATTGSQTTPAPDSGYVGLAVVTVAYGQGSVTSGNIVALGGSPYQPTGAFAQALFGGRKQVFTGNGSFTVPAGVTQIYVSACAGGGGGAGAAGNNGTAGNAGGGGGGGAGGSVQRAAYTVTQGQSIAITIGGGGSAGVGGGIGASGGNGGTGGNTVVGALFTLAGGAGGGGGSFGGGGAGGPGGSGYPWGGSGDDGAVGGAGGAGGSLPYGNGGPRIRGAAGAANNGIAGNGFGGGGGGGSSCYNAASATGGNGAAGLPGVVFIEY